MYYSQKKFFSQLTIVIRNAPPTKAQKPFISQPSTQAATKYRTTTLANKIAKLQQKIHNGRVAINNNGLTTQLRMVSIITQQIAVHKPSTSNPGIRCAINMNINALMNNLIISPTFSSKRF